MVLRKINAGISLIITFLLMDHAIFHAVWMLSRGSVEKNATSMPRILFVLMIIHAGLSIVLAILGHKGADKGKFNGYADMNKLTYMQRGSGIALIPLTVLHILGTVGVLQPPK